MYTSASFLRLNWVVFLMLAVSIGATLTAEQLVVTPEKDTSVWKDTALSSGAGPHLFTGYQAGLLRLRRAFLKFDVSAIPEGSIINSVTLRMTLSRTLQSPPGVRAVDLHRVLADWGEAGSVDFNGAGGGAAAQPGDTTWLHRFYDTELWATPGGDFAPDVSASAALTNIGSYTWGPTAALAEDVRFWVQNPEQNFGWIVRGSPESHFDLQMRLESRENTVVESRPTLTVDYTPVEPFRFLRQPRSRITVTPGTRVEFKVSVDGGVEPYSYQWYKRTDSKAATEPIGADSPALVLESVEFADTGIYFCEVSDTYDTYTSNDAVLEVVENLPILQNGRMSVLYLLSAFAVVILVLSMRPSRVWRRE